MLPVFHFRPLAGFLLLMVCFGKSCTPPPQKSWATAPLQMPALVILGTVQDGGSPHIGCTKKCCESLFAQPDPGRKVVSLGIVDPESKKKFLIEATPDLPSQLKLLHRLSSFSIEMPDGILLTHAHIGHYAGLMYLGREAMNAKKVRVYSMPRMKQFLENNGPWNQLINLDNIQLQEMRADSAIQLSAAFKVTAFTVPHRDEYSETVGYLIEGPQKKVLFIPDIDKWEKWGRNIDAEIKKVDLALIDATFYSSTEINNRNMAEIPHPFVVESMERFRHLSADEKKKIILIHFNHTNPLLKKGSPEKRTVELSGMRVAEFGQVIPM